jgi:hypothetical protein
MFGTGGAAAILVLDSQELRQRPAKVMADVEKHLGLQAQGAQFYEGLAHTSSSTNKTTSSSSSASSSSSSPRLHQLHEQLYPEFAAESGWSSTSHYPPMPAALRERLASFYRPFDELLFAMLGQRLEWAV